MPCTSKEAQKKKNTKKYHHFHGFLLIFDFFFRCYLFQPLVYHASAFKTPSVQLSPIFCRYLERINTCRNALSDSLSCNCCLTILFFAKDFSAGVDTHQYRPLSGEIFALLQAWLILSAFSLRWHCEENKSLCWLPLTAIMACCV